MATALTASIDGTYTAPATINVCFLDDGSGSGWENQGTLTDATGHTLQYDGWTAYEQQQARLAFAQFSAVANVAFNFVGDVSQADFVLATGNSDEVGSPGYWNVGGGRITVNGNDHDVHGVGVFNWDARGWDFVGDAGGLEPGGFGFVTLLDQIARGLGLAHPHSTDGGSTVMNGVTSPTGDYGDFDLNQGIYTTMSLNDGWHAAPHGSSPSDVYGWQGAPMALDIAVLQKAYGANASTNLGDTFYVLPDTHTGGTYYQAIWDAGGTDTIFYRGNGHASIDLRAATLQYESGGGGFVSHVAGIHGGFTIASGVVVENATGGAGNDTIVGNDAANVLSGRQGADLIYAGASHDVIAGGDGHDRLFGGAGKDTLYGGSGNDRLSGHAGADVLFGVGGDDILAGGGGDDRLFGGGEGDTLYGQAGDDRLSGQAGGDVLYGGAGSDVLAGGDGNDRLSGGGNGDTLYGQAGNDRLAGQGSGDVLYGGAGSDRLAGGNGSDRLLGQAGGDVLDGGAGNDIIGGGRGDDLLFGGGDDDRLYGGSGGDRLTGQGGDDLLTGGGGADLFVFQPSGGHDTVTDFQDGFDLLDFRQFGFGDKSTVLNLAAQDGADVLFGLAGGETVRLETFDISLLGGEDILI